jgi:hypothetical protein
MTSLPFLYPPDAITLILFLLVFGLLRKAAIDHIRQELLALRSEILFYWMNNALDFNDCGYKALRNRIDASMALVPTLAPARLMFIYRLQKRGMEDGTIVSLPDPFHEARLLIESTADSDGRANLKRLQTEMNMRLGVFFLMGSLSGWFLLFILISKILRRALSHREGHRVDFFFDMVERILVSLGRQALKIGYISPKELEINGSCRRGIEKGTAIW